MRGKKKTLVSLIAASFIVLSGCQTKAAVKSLTKEEFLKKYPMVQENPNRKIILDTDLVLLNDDSYALFALLQADSMNLLDLIGITTVGGNTLAAAAAYDAISQLEYMNRSDIPVVQGSTEPLAGYQDMEKLQKTIGKMSYTGTYQMLENSTDDFSKVKEKGLSTSTLPEPTVRPKDQSAEDFLIEQIHAHPGQVTILAIGAATNVAKALEKDPTIAQDAQGIIYMGGIFDAAGEDLPKVEINWWYDPAAANKALQADWKAQYVGSDDVSRTCLKGKDVYEMIKAKNTTKVTNLLMEQLSPIYEAGKEEELLYCWDPILPAVLLNPQLAKKEQIRQMVVDEREGITYGSTFSWLQNDGPENVPAATVLLEADRDGFWEFLTDLYSVKIEE